MNKPAKWTVKDIAHIIKNRQINEFDSNIAISGNRGDGKSTLAGKIAYRFSKFEPKIHQVYSRPDVIKLLKMPKGICWDDEAINSGYKRDFQNKGQQDFIKILTAYRDNYNLFMSAIPNFFSLDKDLRDLYFIHLHIIERGIAIFHMPLQGRLYSQDRWDVKHNAKIEESWSKRMLKDPTFKPRYHQLTTFRGYLYFNKLTPKQEVIYKQVKKYKRELSFLTEEEKKASQELSFMDRIYKLLLERKLTRDGLIQACLIEGRKHSTTNSTLNQMLTDRGEIGTVREYLKDSHSKLIHNSSTDQINTLID